jgi:post-segregation antitoxin (ccd killing protein)
MRNTSSAKRRTTLTIPADYLAQAKRIARARHLNLSAVISEAISEGLRQHSETERSEQILEQYKRAFGRFSEEEMLLLDGVILEPVNKR